MITTAQRELLIAFAKTRFDNVQVELGQRVLQYGDPDQRNAGRDLIVISTTALLCAVNKVAINCKDHEEYIDAICKALKSDEGKTFRQELFKEVRAKI